MFKKSSENKKAENLKKSGLSASFMAPPTRIELITNP